jgi:hypothetical protein
VEVQNTCRSQPGSGGEANREKIHSMPSCAETS